MSQHLRRDLEALEKRLLFVAGQAEEAVRRSITALPEQRMDLAERVIEGDREFDRREVELEEECLKALALHHPVASDLRFIAACLKINNDLERVADLAVNIAERAVSLAARESIPAPARFREMMETTTRMLRDAIDAFVRGEAAAARLICERDDEVDGANRLIIGQMLDTMHQDPSTIDQAMQIISVSKNLERIADHATNIAEDVVYLVEGAIIRHRHGIQALR